MSEQEKEITQPVVVNEPTATPTPEEAVDPVDIAPEAPQPELPEWLLKFAASPEQSAEETQPGISPDLLVPSFEDADEEANFVPPAMPGENEWQELADFQDQDELDLEPVLEAQEITAEVEAFEAPEASSETKVVENVVESIEIDPQVEAAENFRQEVRNLLKQGQHEEALAMIRETSTDPLMAEAAKKTLRSQLTLSPDTGDLWDVYDELNSSSL